MKGKHHYLRPPTPESMAKAALAYLARFAASESGLRRVLENRIRRFSLHNQSFGQDKVMQAELQRTIESIIEKHKKSGALNDAAYAETKVHSLRRSGRSARGIVQKLDRAGIAKNLIINALAENEQEAGPEGAEIKAARELARRRRLGIFRKSPYDPDRHRKDLAILARAGFPLGIARRILGDQFDGEGEGCNIVGGNRESRGGWPKD